MQEIQEIQERPYGATVRRPGERSVRQARDGRDTGAQEMQERPYGATVGRLSKKRQGRKGWARQ